MKKRTKTIGEIFDEGITLDAAAKRAVLRAIRENAVLDRLCKPRKAKAPKARRSGKGKRRVA